jgi:hypothetical protein
MKPSDKLTDSQYELANMSNMPMDTEEQRNAIRGYEKQCLADTRRHEYDQERDLEEQVGE